MTDLLDKINATRLTIALLSNRKRIQTIDTLLGAIVPSDVAARES